MDRPKERTRSPPFAIVFFNRRAAKTMSQTHGNYPAPISLLDVVKIGYKQGFAAGLEAERGAILELTQGDARRNLLRLFFLRQGAKKLAAAQAPATPHEIKYAAVIGGGTMGAGIVHALIRAGHSGAAGRGESAGGFGGGWGESRRCWMTMWPPGESASWERGMR